MTIIDMFLKNDSFAKYSVTCFKNIPQNE